MEITLEQAYSGKPTRIKNNEFFGTRAYLEPFIDRMSALTSDFRIQAKLPDQITYTREGEINTDDITYNRLYVQAILPREYEINGHKEVIGMVYGLDVRKPVVKFYCGVENSACTNLCVFSPDALAVQGMESETAIDYRPLNRLLDQTDNVATYLRALQNTEFNCSTQNINESLGKWIRNTMNYSFDNGFGKVKLATSIPIDAYKQLFVDEDSDYYVHSLQDGTTMFNVYNSFTQIVTNQRSKEVMNEFEKILLLKDILELGV